VEQICTTEGVEWLSYSSDQTPDVRGKILERFKSGSAMILIVTAHYSVWLDGD
jgi:superfamily II DNA/RNA helicase